MISIIRKLLSDFSEIIDTSDLPASFNPYFLVILTIIAFTSVIYSFQFFTTTIHIYAQNPVAFRNKILLTQDCNIFFQTSLKKICVELTNTKPTYRDKSLLSFEQDLQSPMK